MIYENINGINKKILDVYENARSLIIPINKKYELIQGINKITYKYTFLDIPTNNRPTSTQTYTGGSNQLVNLSKNTTYYVDGVKNNELGYSIFPKVWQISAWTNATTIDYAIFKLNMKRIRKGYKYKIWVLRHHDWAKNGTITIQVYFNKGTTKKTLIYQSTCNSLESTTTFYRYVFSMVKEIPDDVDSIGIYYTKNKSAGGFTFNCGIRVEEN